MERERERETDRPCASASSLPLPSRNPNLHHPEPGAPDIRPHRRHRRLAARRRGKGGAFHAQPPPSSMQRARRLSRHGGPPSLPRPPRARPLPPPLPVPPPPSASPFFPPQTTYKDGGNAAVHTRTCSLGPGCETIGDDGPNPEGQGRCRRGGARGGVAVRGRLHGQPLAAEPGPPARRPSRASALVSRGALVGARRQLARLHRRQDHLRHRPGDDPDGEREGRSRRCCASPPSIRR